MIPDSVKILQPTIWFSKVCGVFPLTFKQPSISPTYKAYALILAVTLLPPTVLGVRDRLENLHDINAVLYFVVWLIFFFQHCVSLLTPIVTVKSLEKFFSIMDSAQRSLHRLNIKQKTSPSVKSQIIWILLISFCPLTGITVIILNYNFSIRYVLTDFVLTGSFVLLRGLLAFLNEKYELLNWHLDDLNNRWPLFLPRPPDVTFSELSCVARWRRTHFVNYDQNVREVTAEKIRGFNVAHLKLNRALCALNSAFSVQGFAITFCTGITVVYGLFDSLVSPSKHKGSTSFWALTILHVTFSFVAVLVYTTRIKEQSKKTAVLLHDLLDEEIHTDEVVYELEMFSQALIHRKGAFSAAGYFDMDLKLIARMASVLAPITLFFIQNQNRPRAHRLRNHLSH